VNPSAGALRRLGLFFLPLLLAAAYLFLVWNAFETAVSAVLLGAMVTYLVSPLGVEFVVPSAVLAIRLLPIPDPNPAIAMAVLSVILVDVFTALFLLWNFDLAERAPILGKFIDKTEDRCRRFLDERPWRRRLAVVALAVYVALPVQMSGGVVGSILGRVMGVPRYRVFTIVAASSAAGAFPVAAATYVLGPQVLAWAEGWVASGLPLVLGVVVLVTFIAGIAYMVRRSRRNHDEAA